ncbi:NB-ARC domain disease resistance protein, partial [Trifolium medium]|nr:NB-ARC domain disease resistance protein [Trifolium medium]
MCPKHYRIKFPPLAKLELNKCSQAAIKSMSNFIIHPVSESLDSPIIQGTEIIVEEGTTSTNANTVTSTARLELAGSSSDPLVTSEHKTSSHDIEISVEEGSTSTNAKTTTSSTHLELVGSSSAPLVTSECKIFSQ